MEFFSGKICVGSGKIEIFNIQQRISEDEQPAYFRNPSYV
jgi:hypothetical protein